MMNEQTRNQILNYFEMPEVASPFIDFFFDAEEQSLILQYHDRAITEADFPRAYLDQEYHRGVISKTDESGETYRLNNFYGFLDVFCVSRKEEYDRLTMEEKRALDSWYFDAYLETLDLSTGAPTPDRVLPLAEMLQVIEDDPRQIYVNYCDCRSLTGECGLPRRTCLTWNSGINSFVDRGLAKALTKEEAKELLRETDRAGLMHTTMGRCICNCCGDCCYLFRTQAHLKSYGTWPAAQYIAALDEEKCIACGKCVKRCHLGVFQVLRDKGSAPLSPASTVTRRISADFSRCAGCGLCVNTCPTNALTLIERNPS